MLTEHGIAIAQSTYHAHKARAVSDADLEDAFNANTALDIWRANRSLYGAAKLAVAMAKAGHLGGDGRQLGRDQVARLMRIVGIVGNTRGKHRTFTPVGPESGPPPGPDQPGLVHPNPPRDVVGYGLHLFGSVAGYVQLDGLRVWVRLVARRLV